MQIASTRPDVALRLLQGRRSVEVAAAVPRLFAVCAQSQSAACRLALAAAEGMPPDAAMVSAGAPMSHRRWLRETAWHVLLHWPAWAGETPSAAATAAARSLAAAPGEVDRVALAEALFGCPADTFLGLDHWPALQGWAAAQGNATARFVHALEERAGDFPEGPTTPLPVAVDAWCLEGAGGGGRRRPRLLAPAGVARPAGRSRRVGPG